MNMPIIAERFADNGAHSHWDMIDYDTGETLCSELDADELRERVEEAETKVERQHALIISMADLLRECVVKLEECTVDGRIARPVHLLDRLSLLLHEGEEE